MEKTALYLLLALGFLVAFVDSERERLLDWFEHLKSWKQWVYGSLVAVSISICLAVAVGPIVADWYYYLNP